MLLENGIIIIVVYFTTEYVYEKQYVLTFYLFTKTGSDRNLKKSSYFSITQNKFTAPKYSTPLPPESFYNGSIDSG